MNHGLTDLLKQEELKRRKEEIKTDSIVDPEFIVWKNYGYSKKKRFAWNLVSFIIYFVLILV